jgi:hypothetical protein
MRIRPSFTEDQNILDDENFLRLGNPMTLSIGHPLLSLPLLTVTVK